MTENLKGCVKDYLPPLLQSYQPGSADETYIPRAELLIFLLKLVHHTV